MDKKLTTSVTRSPTLSKGAPLSKASASKYFPKMEWSLADSEENGVLLLIFATSEGKGKLEKGKIFTYGRLRNVDYEDSESSNLLLDVQSTTGMRRVVVDDNNLVTDYCTPKVLRKDIQTKNNLIVALRPYVIGELMVAQAECCLLAGLATTQLSFRILLQRGDKVRMLD